MAAIPSGARHLQPSARARAALVKRISAGSAEMTTAALAEIHQRHPWFGQLDAEQRSWITLVARAGVDGFVRWFSEAGQDVSPASIFDAAPRSLMRRITLSQTVDLLRTTVDTVESHLERLVPRGDRAGVYLAIVQYSREVAFAAAELYARAAEERGGWDARLEALVVDAVIRGEADETVVARASTLGWRSPIALTVVIGQLPPTDADLEEIRATARLQGFDLLASPQGDRLVAILGGTLRDTGHALSIVDGFVDRFGPGQVVIGPLVGDLADAAASARAALSAMRASVAWAGAPRPVAADDLLPERALAGDGHARRILAREIYLPLQEAGSDLLETLIAYLDNSSSIEATGRALFVHANTVRYRLRRISDVTGYHPGDPRGAYVLRLAVTLGRLLK